MLELKECKMNHVELCTKINELRKMEGSKKELAKSDLLKKIRKEVETMKTLGIFNEGNFSLAEYKDKKGEMRPTYIMNKDGILQMCASESVYVRAKMIEYINSLEDQISEMDKLILKSLNPNLTQEERIEIERRRAELSKERDEKATWFDDFINSKGTYSSTQIGKLFKIGSGQKMNKLLHENKIIFKQGKNWIPYETVDESWYNLNVGTKNEHSYSQLKFTPKGVYELSKLLNIEFNEEDLKELA